MNFEEWRKNNENNIPFRPESENEFIDWLERAFNAAKPQWQPIETAPKDGTDILAYAPYMQTQEIIRWCELSELWSLGYTFTHWQPLPHPPVV